MAKSRPQPEVILRRTHQLVLVPVWEPWCLGRRESGGKSSIISRGLVLSGLLLATFRGAFGKLAPCRFKIRRHLVPWYFCRSDGPVPGMSRARPYGGRAGHGKVRLLWCLLCTELGTRRLAFRRMDGGVVGAAKGLGRYCCLS